MTHDEVIQSFMWYLFWGWINPLLSCRGKTPSETPSLELDQLASAPSPTKCHLQPNDKVRPHRCCWNTVLLKVSFSVKSNRPSHEWMHGLCSSLSTCHVAKNSFSLYYPTPSLTQGQSGPPLLGIPSEVHYRDLLIQRHGSLHSRTSSTNRIKKHFDLSHSPMLNSCCLSNQY